LLVCAVALGLSVGFCLQSGNQPVRQTRKRPILSPETIAATSAAFFFVNVTGCSGSLMIFQSIKRSIEKNDRMQDVIENWLIVSGMMKYVAYDAEI